MAADSYVLITSAGSIRSQSLLAVFAFSVYSVCKSGGEPTSLLSVRWQYTSVVVSGGEDGGMYREWRFGIFSVYCAGREWDLWGCVG